MSEIWTPVRVFSKEENLSFERFKKTYKEKEDLKLAKYKWRNEMRLRHPNFTHKKGFKFSQS
jgi:hypothetical protein